MAGKLLTLATRTAGMFGVLVTLRTALEGAFSPESLDLQTIKTASDVCVKLGISYLTDVSSPSSQASLTDEGHHLRLASVSALSQLLSEGWIQAAIREGCDAAEALTLATVFSAWAKKMAERLEAAETDRASLDRLFESGESAEALALNAPAHEAPAATLEPLLAGFYDASLEPVARFAYQSFPQARDVPAELRETTVRVLAKWFPSQFTKSLTENPAARFVYLRLVAGEAARLCQRELPAMRDELLAVRTKLETILETIQQANQIQATVLCHSGGASFEQLEDRLKNYIRAVLDDTLTNLSSTVSIDYPLDRTSYIEEKTAGFVGRDFLINEFLSFRDTKNIASGYNVLTSSPGIGKSAVAATLVKRFGCVHHFFDETSGHTTANGFYTNVCAQLVDRYGLAGSVGRPHALIDHVHFDKVLTEAAAAAGERGEKITLVIDALDELDESSSAATANTLLLPRTLPPGVYVFATTRPKKVRLTGNSEIQFRVLEWDSRENLADVREYLEAVLSAPDWVERVGGDAQQLTKTLLEHSQGNFMYLRYVLPALISGEYALSEPDELPRGLDDYYERHWLKMREIAPSGWESSWLGVLGILANASDMLPVGLLPLYVNPEKPTSIREALTAWEQFLDERQHNHNGVRDRLIGIYHGDFKRFLRNRASWPGGAVAYFDRLARQVLEVNARLKAAAARPVI